MTGPGARRWRLVSGLVAVLTGVGASAEAGAGREGDRVGQVGAASEVAAAWPATLGPATRDREPPFRARGPGAWRHDRERSTFVELGRHPPFRSVGRLRRSDEPGGSGILIHPEWVLTAAHVVDRRRPGDGTRFELGGRTSAVSEIHLHPEYEGPRRVDLALVRLDRPITDQLMAGVDFEPLRPGERVALVGFGYALPGNTMAGDQTPPGTRHAGFNRVDEVSDARAVIDLDHPDHPELNASGSAEPDSLEYVPLGGDSGGAVMRRTDVGWTLAGVISGGVRIDMQHLDRWGWYGLPMHLEDLSPRREWVASVSPDLVFRTR